MWLSSGIFIACRYEQVYHGACFFYTDLMEYRQNLCTFACKTKHELEMKRYLTYILLLLLTCLCVPQVEAASSVFRNLSVSDGLPDLVINVIYKDSKGYVWMGTNTSVERFDGIRLEHYMVEAAMKT